MSNREYTPTEFYKITIREGDYEDEIIGEDIKYSVKDKILNVYKNSTPILLNKKCSKGDTFDVRCRGDEVSIVGENCVGSMLPHIPLTESKNKPIEYRSAFYNAVLESCSFFEEYDTFVTENVADKILNRNVGVNISRKMRSKLVSVCKAEEKAAKAKVNRDDNKSLVQKAVSERKDLNGMKKSLTEKESAAFSKLEKYANGLLKDEIAKANTSKEVTEESVEDEVFTEGLKDTIDSIKKTIERNKLQKRREKLYKRYRETLADAENPEKIMIEILDREHFFKVYKKYLEILKQDITLHMEGKTPKNFVYGNKDFIDGKFLKEAMYEWKMKKIKATELISEFEDTSWYKTSNEVSVALNHQIHRITSRARTPQAEYLYGSIKFFFDLYNKFIDCYRSSMLIYFYHPEKLKTQKDANGVVFKVTDKVKASVKACEKRAKVRLESAEDDDIPYIEAVAEEMGIEYEEAEYIWYSEDDDILTEGLYDYLSDKKSDTKSFITKHSNIGSKVIKGINEKKLNNAEKDKNLDDLRVKIARRRYKENPTKANELKLQAAIKNAKKSGIKLSNAKGDVKQYHDDINERRKNKSLKKQIKREDEQKILDALSQESVSDALADLVLTEAAKMEDEIKGIVNTFNSKGYTVKYASPGHYNLRKKEDREPDGVYYSKLYTDARVMFTENFSLSKHKAPKHWKWREVEGCDYLDADEIRYNEKDGTPNEVFKKFKSEAMTSLREFANSLPKRGESVKEESMTLESVEQMDFNSAVEDIFSECM